MALLMLGEILLQFPIGAITVIPFIFFDQFSHRRG